MKYLMIAALLLSGSSAYAQLGKDLWNHATQSVQGKLNSKVDQSIDKAVNAPEEAAKKKKEKKSAKSSEKPVRQTSSESSNEEGTAATRTTSADNSMSGDGSQTVIQTNITCETGSRKTIAALKELDGVFEVKINIKNGELAIRYSSDGTSYTGLLEAITALGFEADGSKPASGTSNPCKGGKK